MLHLAVVRNVASVLRHVLCHISSSLLHFSLSVFGYLNCITHAFDARSCNFRIGNILFSVETQTTEERTQLYHAEIDALYKDLTAKGKILILSSEFGVSFVCFRLICAFCVSFVNCKASALSLKLYPLCLNQL